MMRSEFASLLGSDLIKLASMNSTFYTILDPCRYG